jgi:hypothetical protein
MPQRLGLQILYRIGRGSRDHTTSQMQSLPSGGNLSAGSHVRNPVRHRDREQVVDSRIRDFGNEPQRHNPHL